MLEKMNKGDLIDFELFQREILRRQLQQINYLPKTGIVIVISDRYIWDIAGYSKMNGLSDIKIKQIFEKYKNQDYINRVFMFTNYIHDTSKSNDRFTQLSAQQKESKNSYKFINDVYQNTIDQNKISEVPYNDLEDLNQSINNRVALITRIIISDIKKIFKISY